MWKSKDLYCPIQTPGQWICLQKPGRKGAIYSGYKWIRRRGLFLFFFNVVLGYQWYLCFTTSETLNLAVPSTSSLRPWHLGQTLSHLNQRTNKAIFICTVSGGRGHGGNEDTRMMPSDPHGWIWTGTPEPNFPALWKFGFESQPAFGPLDAHSSFLPIPKTLPRIVLLLPAVPGTLQT